MTVSDSRHLPQDITHWAVTPDGYGGFTFAAPTILKGRWEEKNEVVRKSDGEEAVSKTVVYINNAVTASDYLFKGTSTTADPTTLAGAAQVVAYSEIPAIRGAKVTRKAWL